MAEEPKKKATKDEALQALLDAHARRENRNIDGQGHQYHIYDRCPLCDAARQALGIDEEEFEVVADSSPTVRIEDKDKKKTPAVENTARTPKAAEGDETPAGYLGYDGPKEQGQRTQGAGTSTLDNQATAKPLDPKMAGPDAQRKAQEQRTQQAKKDDPFAELSPEEVARRKAQRGR